jgi:hypothetical protein
MLSQILAIVLLILEAPFAIIAAWIALILTVVSGIEYAAKFIGGSLG